MNRIDDLPGAIMVLAIVALTAGVFAILFEGLEDSQETTRTATNDTINFTALDTDHTLITANSTATDYFVTIDNASVTVVNSTVPFLRQGNWSVNLETGAIQALTGGAIPIGGPGTVGVVNVSYTYQTGNEGRDRFSEGITAVAEVTGWLDLIGLIIAASVILYLVLSNFGMLGGSKGKEGY